MVANNLPEIWAPVVINSFFIRLLLSYYITLEVDNLIYSEIVLALTSFFYYVFSFSAIVFRVKNKAGNSLVNIMHFFDTFSYYCITAVIIFLEKFLIRTSNEDHFIYSNTLALLMEIIAFIFWALLLLTKGRLVFWESDQGKVQYTQVVS